MIPMTNNNSLFRNKISDDKSESKQITTLPAAVTICLASCSECCGEYIDSTSSFRICCLCPCGHKLSYSNKTRSQNENAPSEGVELTSRRAADSVDINVPGLVKRRYAK